MIQQEANQETQGALQDHHSKIRTVAELSALKVQPQSLTGRAHAGHQTTRIAAAFPLHHLALLIQPLS